MARPRKERLQQRSEMLRCRLKPVELVRVQKAAHAAGLTLSDYVRAAVVDGKLVVTRETSSFDSELYDQLRRIGVNLNQAVHRFHATGKAPPELTRAAAAVEKAVMDLIGP